MVDSNELTDTLGVRKPASEDASTSMDGSRGDSRSDQRKANCRGAEGHAWVPGIFQQFGGICTPVSVHIVSISTLQRLTDESTALQ